MKYDRKILRKSIEALNPQEFRKSLDDFPDVRREFVDGQQKYLRVEIVLDYFELHQEKIDRLLEAIRNCNSTAYDNYVMCERALKEEKVTPKSYNFDLTPLIDKSLEKLIFCKNQSGIIGFTIYCDEDLFLRNFCERLKNEYNRTETLIKPSLPVNPKLNSLKRNLDKIKKYKRLLETKNVICPIRWEICNYSDNFDNLANISNTFWQSLCVEFGEGFKYRLIVIMTGSEYSVFPDQAIKIEPPQFKRVHVYLWTHKIVERLKWKKSIADKWMQLMIAECSENNLLDIGSVYEHIYESLQLLQQNPSDESFLRELEKRSQYYA